MTEKNKCGFCQSELAGEDSYLQAPDKSIMICASCIQTTLMVLGNNNFEPPTPLSPPPQQVSIPSAKELVKELDRHVIGQDGVKRTLAIAMNLHLNRLHSENDEEVTKLIKKHNLQNVTEEKSNILCLGPTGCGKTLIAKTLANYIGVPCAIGDATTLTEAGYVGEDVENLLLNLLRAANFDLESAQKGILIIDEIDKIGKRSSNVSITRDVSGEGVQQSLLKIIEGTIANIPPQGGRKHPEQEYIRMDTSNILFICSGTFVGIEHVIKKRLTGNNKIGFQSAIDSSTLDGYNELIRYIQPEDLIEYGLIPEFVGRVPRVAGFQKLSKQEFKRILTEPDNAIIKQKKKIFLRNKAILTFTDEALSAIAESAYELEVGARGLRNIVDNLLEDMIFELSESDKKKYHVTKDLVMESRN